MFRFKFGFVFRNHKFYISCETRKWSVTCLPLAQHTEQAVQFLILGILSTPAGGMT